MDVAEVDSPDVVGATVGIEKSTSVGLGKVDVFFWRCDISLEVTAEIGFKWMDGDFGVCAKV